MARAQQDDATDAPTISAAPTISGVPTDNDASDIADAPTIGTTPTLSDAPTIGGAAPVAGAGRAPEPAPASSQRKTPARIGRYEILGELGRGGMGVVYKARDPNIGRTVAIKSILPASFLDGAEFSQYEQRFYRESQAAGQLSHIGIVAVHDLIFDEEQPAIVMEFVEGESLERLMAKGRLRFERCLEIVLAVAEALDYAHGRGVVHRDIKPANILITHDGQVKITDFGVAKLEGTRLTRTGEIVGTPAFMSPEQFKGEAVDGRSDLFSLGSLLYWLCTGQKPFRGRTLSAIGVELVQKDPVPACQLDASLPPAIDVILARLLAKDPGKRYPTGRHLASDLEALKHVLRRSQASAP